ncbi:MAG: hypothetical protein KAX80_15385, partial [Planctomycetes bacterium]|nr:hypothetical protein [Planctomycetota bacterium]
VEHWHRVRIYHYRFTADGQRIEVLVDRLAEMPTAVETDELSVAAWVGAEDLSALQEHTLHYEFCNKTRRPVSVSVLARGEVGVPVSVEETFELTGRHRLAVAFRLPADLERKRPGEPPHRVLSTVTVAGVPIRLGTAVRKRDPVEVDYRGGGLPAGKWTDVRINLRNRLPFPVSGALSVGSAPEVERTEEKLAFRIPRGGRGSVSLRVRAQEVGVHALELCVNFSREAARRLAKGETLALPARGRVQRAWLRAFAPGVFVASRDEENRIVTVESDRMTVAFHRAGGWLQVREKVRGRQLMSMRMPEVGPPFGAFSPVPKIYDTETRQVDGQIHLVTRQQEERHPGLTLERILVVTPGLLEVRHRLLNVGAESTRVQVRVSVYGGLGPATLTIPRGEGVLQHESVGWGDWPVYGELRERPEEDGERWVAAEYEGAVVGVIWEGVKEIRPGNSGGATVTYGPLSVPAGGSVETPPLRLVAGWGDYRTVRSVWATYVHPEPLRTPEEREPATRKLIRGGLNQVPALLGGSPRINLRVAVGEQSRALDGEAELTLPPVVKSSAGGRSLQFPVR